MVLHARLASDAVLDAAFEWLCRRRRDYPADADVWSFRRDWPDEKSRIQADLLAGAFRFGLLDRITLADGSVIDLWSARDALVLENRDSNCLLTSPGPGTTLRRCLDRRDWSSPNIRIT